MYRQAQAELKKWFYADNRKPLVIRGARQVGKSTLVRKFAEAERLDLLEVNLETHRKLRDVFKTLDPDKILRAIQVATGQVTAPSTLLFFDEIQAIPDALSALRYFYEQKPTLPVLAAGSLLEFVLSDHVFSMPVGRIEFFYLGPVNFEEYLEASGETLLLQALSEMSASTPPLK